MPYDHYPDVNDLTDFLTEAKLDLTNLDLQRAADHGWRRFEERTGRRMLADAEDVERVFDPPTAPSGQLIIPDLASLSSLVYQPMNGSAQALTPGRDFHLGPSDAPQRGRPWNAVLFFRRWNSPLAFAEMRSVRISGKWGFGTTIREDDFAAMLQLAALHLLPQINRALTGGSQSEKTEDLSVVYDAKTLADDWKRESDAVVASRKKVYF